MLRPGGVARPALARAFTTKLSWAGSPRSPTLVMTEWLIVTYHCRTFTGWTGSLMGCKQRRQDAKAQGKLESFFASPRLGDLALSFVAGWTPGDAPALPDAGGQDTSKT